MYQRILIPVDFSDRSRRSLDQAVLLGHEGSSVTLLHIVEEIEHLNEAEDQSFYHRLADLANERMASLVSYGESLGLTIQVEIRLGKTARDILEFARDDASDIIVMSSRTLPDHQPWKALDSVSHAVALFANCAVFLVR